MSQQEFPPPSPHDLSEAFHASKPRRPSGPGRALRILLLCCAGTFGLLALGLVNRLLVVNDARSMDRFTGTLVDRINNADTILVTVALVTFYLVIATIVLEIIWTYRMSSTLRKRGLPPRMADGMAIGGFFIPAVNLAFPYLFQLDFVRALSFRRQSGLTPSPQSVSLGWWLRVGSLLLAWILNIYREDAETLNGLFQADLLLCLCMLATLAGCIISARYVNGFNMDIDALIDGDTKVVALD